MKDLIYRQAAIDTINELHDKPNAWLDLAVDTLENLPSAQPEPSQVARDIATIIENERDMRVILSQPQKRIVDKVKIDGEELQRCIHEAVKRVRNEDTDEWCTGCKEYDKERHCCPRWNRVIRETVEEWKSNQPEIIHCGDCRHWKNNHLCECLSRYGTFETEIHFYCGFAEKRDE